MEEFSFSQRPIASPSLSNFSFNDAGNVAKALWAVKERYSIRSPRHALQHVRK